MMFGKVGMRALRAVELECGFVSSTGFSAGVGVWVGDLSRLAVFACILGVHDV
jgi:hypothetical protein